MNFSLSEIVSAVSGKLHAVTPAAENQRYVHLSTDTRSLQQGDIFLALRGENFDGHRFLSEAVSKGAALLLVEKNSEQSPLNVPVVTVTDTLHALGDLAAAWRKRFSIPVLAITGSNGKTTTRNMTGTLLSVRYRVHQTRGNLNNWIGMPQTLLDLNADDEMIVLEMGMNQAGEISRLAEIARPTVGLITNIGPVHLEKLRTLENVAKAKGELFQSMAAQDPQSIAVVNADDELCLQQAELAGFTGKRRLLYGCKNPQKLSLDVSGEISRGGLKIFSRLNGENQTFEMQLPLPGEHNAMNLLASTVVALHFQLSPETIQQGVSQIKPVGSRTRIVELPKNRNLIDDCYNANPMSMRAALRLLNESRVGGKTVAVLGEMLELGENTAQEHENLGKFAAESGVSSLFTVGENADRSLEGSLKGGINKKCVKSFHGGKSGKPPESVIEALATEVLKVWEPQGWLLVKGSRGMALERLVKILVDRLAGEQQA